MIHGVQIRPLTRIVDERGEVMHMFKKTDPEYDTFGEIYFSAIHPGVVKAWHLHERMTLHYAVITGVIKLVLFDNRRDSTTKGKVYEVVTGEHNYSLITIPPGIWNGFMGLGTQTSIVANCSDIPHDPVEIKRMDPQDQSLIRYDWQVKWR